VAGGAGVELAIGFAGGRDGASRTTGVRPGDSGSTAGSVSAPACEPTSEGGPAPGATRAVCAGGRPAVGVPSWPPVWGGGPGVAVGVGLADSSDGSSAATLAVTGTRTSAGLGSGVRGDACSLSLDEATSTACTACPGESLGNEAGTATAGPDSRGLFCGPSRSARPPRSAGPPGTRTASSRGRSLGVGPAGLSSKPATARTATSPVADGAPPPLDTRTTFSLTAGDGGCGGAAAAGRGLLDAAGGEPLARSAGALRASLPAPSP
jgi:hypothetical protein